MAKLIEGKLNRLERSLPEGLLVDADWLQQHGYSTSLRHQYVKAGWLENPARRVYRRGKGNLSWQQVVISLQTLLGRDLIVGGRTALELHGYSHYIHHAFKPVHLYGPEPLPGWIYDLPIDWNFHCHNTETLFPSRENADKPRQSPAPLELNHEGVGPLPWGHLDWEIVVSTPERAILELLDELPNRESFHQIDKLVEGLSNLSPRRLQSLLVDCRSVKVKRLFFFFADRHRHAWLNHIDKKAVDLGKGKRLLVKGGKLDSTYGITVPEDLDGME